MLWVLTLPIGKHFRAALDQNEVLIASVDYFFIFIFLDFLFFFCCLFGDRKVAEKNYAVRQHMVCPSTASQQSECNDPAPQ